MCQSRPHAPIRRSLLTVLAAAIVAASPAAASALDVTSCAQSIPENDVGVLQVDLVCPSTGGIVLSRGATLQMNGHSLAAESPQGGQVGVGCIGGSCRIEGPGEVSGFQGVGIFGLDASRLEVSDLDVHDNGVGIFGNRVTLTNVILSANSEWGASGHRLRATNVTAVGNDGEGLVGRTIRGSDIVVTDNGRDGVQGNRVKLERVAATGNGGFGVRSTFPGITRLRDSTVTGNTKGDVGSQRQPRLQGTSCAISRRLSESSVDQGTWGVCSAD